MESSNIKQPTNLSESFRAVSPALDYYIDDALLNGVWKRAELSRRDRSLVTCAALIARLQTVAMPYYFALALDSGLKPSELSETITHLAFYSGWPNATAAVVIAAELFQSRHVTQHDLPPAKDKLLPLNEAAEAQRETLVTGLLGSTSPGLVQNTTDLLFRDLWLPPALAPRDRSLVTVTALVASGQVAQVPFHLNRAMDSGLTASEAGEVLTHVAFYAGWPCCFSAAPSSRMLSRSVPSRNSYASLGAFCTKLKLFEQQTRRRRWLQSDNDDQARLADYIVAVHTDCPKLK